MNKFEKILNDKRGYISRYPENRKIVMIVSGGLDSIATAARLMEECNLEIFPLHIHRGQTNSQAESNAVNFFTEYFQERYGKNKYHTPMMISVNVPPVEFKKDLLPYTKEKGHPMRDPIMHLLGVEYAVSVSQLISEPVKVVYCAIVPEDYFPHSTLDGMRTNTINTCINMGDWEWQISSPNIDPLLSEPFGKKEEIKWCMDRQIPIGNTISCNDAGEKTNHLACGSCKSCFRRHTAFTSLGYDDPTEYYEKPHFEQFI